MRSRVRFAAGPRCFNISFVIPSGPGAFFCFIFFSASSSSLRVRHSVIHGSKPAVAELWSTARVWVLTSLTLSAEGEAVLSSSKTLARTFAAAFPVTAPFVVCSVVLPRSELSPFSDFLGVSLHVEGCCFCFPACLGLCLFFFVEINLQLGVSSHVLWSWLSLHFLSGLTQFLVDLLQGIVPVRLVVMPSTSWNRLLLL